MFHRPLCLILLIASSVLADSDSYHNFEDSRGRGIEACILDFDPHANAVKLRLRNKRIRSVKIDVFSESSQLYIRDWYQSKSLLSGKTLTLSIKKKSLLSDREVRNGWESYPSGMDFEDVAYEITLQNKGKKSLSDVKLEYCIYYERTIDETTHKWEVVPDWGHRGTDHVELPRQKIMKTSIGIILLNQLDVKNQLKETTKKVRLYDGKESKVNTIETNKGHYRTIKDKIVGIRVHVSIPLPSGRPATKEFSYPTDLIKRTEWPKKNAQPPLSPSE